MHTVMNSTFGDILKRMRLERKLTQRGLGNKYGWIIGNTEGVYPSVIAGWESNRVKASRKVIENLAEALKATPAERDELLMAAGFMPEGADLSALRVAAGYEQPSALLPAVQQALPPVTDTTEEDKAEFLEGGGVHAGGR